MSDRKRDPRQRIAAAVFLLFASVLLICAALFSHYAVLSDVLLNAGVAIASVIIISLLWRFIGGQPFEEAILKIQDASEAMSQIASCGVTRLYPERLMGLEQRVDELVRRTAHAKEIDLLGLTLYRNWFQHPELCRALIRVLTTNRGRVRIVIVNHQQSDPAYTGRLAQPAEADSPQLLVGQVGFTYSEVRKIYKHLTSRTRNLTSRTRNRVRLEVRHPTDTILYQTILRIDDYMFVSPYVASTIGDYGFGMEIVGREHTLFRLYAEEFETVFANSTTMDFSAKALRTFKLEC